MKTTTATIAAASTQPPGEDPNDRASRVWARAPPWPFLETLVRGADRRVVDWRESDLRSVSRVFLSAEVRLLHFEGRALRRFGIGAERAHAGGYAECQDLSAALHARLPGAR